jgi:hypothetical protein
MVGVNGGPDTARNEVDRRGYTVLAGAIPLEAVEVALRHLHLDVVERGLSAETIGEWLWSTHWFPHLRWDPPVVSLADHIPPEFREGEMCEPQIVLQPPDASSDGPVTSHIDQEPDWADGRRYARIVGVPLTRSYPDNGGLIVWPFEGPEQETVDLAPGDMLVMHPRLPHSSGFNRQGGIRYAVYFRFLEDAARAC